MMPREVFESDANRAAFLALAARIFGVAADTLSADTARGSLPEWDSVNHLRLVMEAEPAFGVAYPLERIPALNSLGDFFIDN